MNIESVEIEKNFGQFLEHGYLSAAILKLSAMSHQSHSCDYDSGKFGYLRLKKISFLKSPCFHFFILNSILWERFIYIGRNLLEMVRYHSEGVQEKSLLSMFYFRCSQRQNHVASQKLCIYVCRYVYSFAMQ
jgi:hypothetical protein